MNNNLLLETISGFAHLNKESMIIVGDSLSKIYTIHF